MTEIEVIYLIIMLSFGIGLGALMRSFIEYRDLQRQLQDEDNVFVPVPGSPGVAGPQGLPGKPGPVGPPGPPGPPCTCICSERAEILEELKLNLATPEDISDPEDLDKDNPEQVNSSKHQVNQWSDRVRQNQVWTGTDWDNEEPAEAETSDQYPEDKGWFDK